MATAIKSAPSIDVPKVELPKVEIPGIDSEQLQATTDRFQKLSQQMLDASKELGVISLNAYEQSVGEVIDMEHKVAEAFKVDWLTEMTQVHTTLVRDITGTYAKTTREMLS